jgi:predicted nucleic acid-binding protein
MRRNNQLVVDTNRIIVSLIKNSVSQQIMNHPFLEFITLDHTPKELSEYETMIKKAKLTHKEFNLLILLIFEKITIIPKEEYENFLDKAKILIDDINDVPFIALSLAMKVDGIWTDDTHFRTQKQETNHHISHKRIALVI